MLRKFACTLLALIALHVGTTSAQAEFGPANGSSVGPAVGKMGTTATGATALSYFEWTQDDSDPANKIFAYLSPDLYGRLVHSGLDATTGTVSTAPVVLGGSPGSGRLKLGTVIYQSLGSNGWAQKGNFKVYVVRLKKLSPPVTLPNIAGIWKHIDAGGKWDPHHPVIVTVWATPTGYAYNLKSNQANYNGVITIDQNTYKFQGWHATKITPNQIHWNTHHGISFTWVK